MGNVGQDKKASNEFIKVGEVALDGTNPTPVVTGFSTITGAVVIEKTASAPALTASTFSYSVSGGTLNIYAWQPTGAGDTTLVASTDTGTVGYMVSGY